MEKDIQQNELAAHDVKARFDETLARHMEEGTGTSHRIGGLPLNLATISCLVLLAEREGEIEAFPTDPPERYTRESFLDDLEDVGLDSDEDVETQIQGMIEKGHIGIDPDGSLLAQKPAIDTARLLDQAFPGMPGLNLVAYLVQTIDEVLSGRKDLEFAVTQFDQTLRMHGAGLAEQEEAVATKQKEIRQSTEALKSALSETLRKRRAEKGSHARPAGTAGQPLVLTSTGETKKVEIKEFFPKRDQPAETTAGLIEEEQSQAPETPEDEPETPAGEPKDSYNDPEALQEEAQGTAPEPDSDQDDVPGAALPADETVDEMPSEQETPSSLLEDPEQEEFTQEPEPGPSGAEGDRVEVVLRTEEPQAQTGSAPQKQEPLTSDESLEERIAAFQQDLAMSCPLCSTGRIEKQETAKGKSFYACSNRDCVFVSWGKPYHLTCPSCRNPFLIESTDKAGQTILKCPRATCRYQQKPHGETSDAPLEQALSTHQEPLKSPAASPRPKKKRKVARRRVVRRKR